MLKETLQRLLLCPECHQPTVNFVNDQKARMGFARKLTISFDWERNFYTSKHCTRSNKKQGRNKFEINVRAIIAFWEIGRGMKAIKSFSRCMNINSVSDPTYGNIHEHFCKAYEIAAITVWKEHLMRLFLLLQHTKVASLYHLLKLMVSSKNVAIHLQMVLWQWLLVINV